MAKHFGVILVFALLSGVDAIRGVGINLGNVLDAPHEGAWAPPAQEYYFDDYKSVGFDLVRIPVRWDEHIGTQPPYTINATFLARVHQVVGWCLARDFICIINSHHDDWLDSPNFSQELPRFTALWTQVSQSFASSPPNLYFEVFNEPHVMTLDNLNQMNAAVVPIMRRYNPTRVIFLGGLSWMSPNWILSNPNSMTWPSGGNLHLEVHSYDPYNVCLQSPPTVTNWGSPADQAAISNLVQSLSSWSQAHGDTPVYLGEMGCIRSQPNRTARVLWYQTVAKAWRPTSNIEMFSVWDDDGDFAIYNRTARTWDQQIIQALGLGRSHVAHQDSVEENSFLKHHSQGFNSKSNIKPSHEASHSEDDAHPWRVRSNDPPIQLGSWQGEGS